MKLRFRELLVAFLLAVGIWYSVTGSEKVESQIDVRVDYRGLPEGLVLLDSTASRVSVRIRASAGILRSLSGRAIACFMDLSSLKKGENVLPVDPRQILVPGGVELIDVTPSRMYLRVDSVERKVVPLKARLVGDLPADYTADVRFEPAEVAVSGASGLVRQLEEIVLPVTFDGPVVPGSTMSTLVIPLPEGVGGAPSETRATLHIAIKRKLVTVTRTIEAQGPPAFGLFVRPAKVKLTLAVPVTFAAKAASSKEIRAFVQAGRPELGTYSLPLQLTLPEGAELVKAEPEKVSLTVEQQQGKR